MSDISVQRKRGARRRACPSTKHPRRHGGAGVDGSAAGLRDGARPDRRGPPDLSRGPEGAVADYIPALAQAPAELFGIAVAGVGGRDAGVGDSAHAFTIQSVAKPFVFALVCEALGHREVRERLGVNATGLPFDSVMAVELAADGLTNPMVNSGAIATTSLVPGRTAELKWAFLREGLSRFAGRDLELDEDGARLRARDERPQRGDGATARRARTHLLRPRRGDGRLHPAGLPPGHRRGPRADGCDAGRRGCQPGHASSRGQRRTPVAVPWR